MNMLGNLQASGFNKDISNINYTDCKPEARNEFAQFVKRAQARYLGQCLTRGLNPVTCRPIYLQCFSTEEAERAVSMGAFEEIQREAALCQQVPALLNYSWDT